MIRLIDMGIGNLRSVLEAFRRVGATIEIATRAEQIEQATALVLPGVGAFGDGMASLRQRGQIEPLRRNVLELKKPLLGICLGMQLLAEQGEEHGLHEGLGLIRGRAVRLSPNNPQERVPNIGWCDVSAASRDSSLFKDVVDGESFYFAHSYYLECTDTTDVTATIEYGGQRVTAAIERGKIFGVQFHPEKSQEAGLNALASYIDYVEHVTGKAAAL